LQDQVLDLLGLFGGLVLGGGEGGSGGHQLAFDGIVGGRGPGLEHGLAPGIGCVVVGQGDLGLRGIAGGDLRVGMAGAEDEVAEVAAMAARCSPTPRRRTDAFILSPLLAIKADLLRVRVLLLFLLI
jgi:hypothetical protein